jgi:hypothetical protein
MIPRWQSFLAIGALALDLAACASPPIHYYTLVPVATGSASDMAVPVPFELLPVGVPAQVDVPQLVIRQGGQDVVVLNGERWIAPLANEVHAALAAYLADALGAQDLSGLPGSDQSRLRIKLDLRRFDSIAGQAALIDAVWSVRSLKGGAAVTCTSRLSEPVGPGYDALVQGHQQAIARLADEVADVSRAVHADRTPTCPE